MLSHIYDANTYTGLFTKQKLGSTLFNFLTNPLKQEENKYVYNLTSLSFHFISFIHKHDEHKQSLNL
jgi:hypothetical protein